VFCKCEYLINFERKGSKKCRKLFYTAGMKEEMASFPAIVFRLEAGWSFPLRRVRANAAKKRLCGTRMREVKMNGKEI